MSEPFAVSVHSKIPLGISQCLLGDAVRYDGGHKRNDVLLNELAPYVEFVPLCPEVAIGLGVPRAPIQLVVDAQQTQLATVLSLNKVNTLPRQWLTLPMQQYGASKAAQLAHLCGYVFMQKSPSCGLWQVKRYRASGELHDERGRGLFAAAVTDALPWLPVEEAANFCDGNKRLSFYLRMFTLWDFQQTLGFAFLKAGSSHEKPLSAKVVLDFYSRYKYLVMAHSQASYKAIGRYLAQPGRDINLWAQGFLALLMTAFARAAGRKGNSNALEHLRGYGKHHLSRAQQQTLSEALYAYRCEGLPLTQVRSLLQRSCEQLDDPYFHAQRFWQPIPLALEQAIERDGLIDSAADRSPTV